MIHARLLPLVVLAAACAAPRTVVPTNAGGAPFTPAPAYAALFALGRSWTYDIETIEDQEAGGQESSTATLTCRVVASTPSADRVESEIACDLGDAPVIGQRWTADLVGGAWAADARGLYQDDSLVIAAKADEDDSAGCAAEEGDDDLRRICFTDAGIAEGSQINGGALLTEVNFTLADEAASP